FLLFFFFFFFFSSRRRHTRSLRDWSSDVCSSDLEPYMVILSHHERADSQQAFASMRAAEAYIRRNTPRPSARSTFWDRDAPKPRSEERRVGKECRYRWSP